MDWRRRQARATTGKVTIAQGLFALHICAHVTEGGWGTGVGRLGKLRLQSGPCGVRLGDSW